MLTNFQIEDLCKRMNVPLAEVCFKDELPYPLEFNKTYIINLQDSDNDEGENNTGTHWTALQINKEKGKVSPIYFDPYGAPPPENVKRIVKKMTNMKNTPYSTKDIQSLMNNACGWYCCAFAYWINNARFKGSNIYESADLFLGLFDDLNKSVDWKKNEYILKHFFRSSDPKLRKVVDVGGDIHVDPKFEGSRTLNVGSIVEPDQDRPDITKIGVKVALAK